jgi:hypothetical protein
VSCKSIVPEKHAKLELAGELHFVSAFGLYTISGTVKNSGDAAARSVWVYVTIFPIAIMARTVANPYDIQPGASASFAVAFSDQDQSIRNNIEKSATRVDFGYQDSSDFLKRQK